MGSGAVLNGLTVNYRQRSRSGLLCRRETEKADCHF
jgi:hypothetical protein